MGIGLICIAEKNCSLILETLLALFFNWIHRRVVLDGVSSELPHASKAVRLRALIIMFGYTPESNGVGSYYSGKGELGGGLLVG